MSLILGSSPLFSSPKPQSGTESQTNTNTTDSTQESQTDTNGSTTTSSGTTSSDTSKTNTTSTTQSSPSTAAATAPLAPVGAQATASSKSVIEVQVASVEPTDDIAAARRNAEAAQEAYKSQAVIDQLLAGPQTSSTASLFEASSPTDDGAQASQGTAASNPLDAPLQRSEPVAEPKSSQAA